MNDLCDINTLSEKEARILLILLFPAILVGPALNYSGTSRDKVVHWQGAQVDDSAFIDTVDIMDIDCLVIGKNAVVGEGATVMAHTFKDGAITFSKVRICFKVMSHIFVAK